MKHLTILLFILLPSVVMAEGSPFMAQIDFSVASEQKRSFGDKIRVEVFSNQVPVIARNLSAWPDITVEKSLPSSLILTMGTQPQYAGNALDKYGASSFVIDLDEEATQEFIAGFEEANSASFNLQQLTAYVNAFITDTTYIHAFNIASVVAKERSGDCTEFAVLTTALARALDIPARVVVGTVMMEHEGEVGAFGHAWTEVWFEEQWQILDAALFDDDINSLFYLPAGALENEGFGFMMSLAEATIRMPSKIALLDTNLNQTEQTD